MSVSSVTDNGYADYYYQSYGKKSGKVQPESENAFGMEDFSYDSKETKKTEVAVSRDEEAVKDRNFFGGVVPFRMPLLNEASAGELALGAATLHISNDLLYDFKAEYTKEFSEDYPVIKVTLNKNGKMTEHYVNIRDIDPRNATEIEMFALASYMDANGMRLSDDVSTWQLLKDFRNDGFRKGYLGNITADIEKSGLENVKMDWYGLIEKVREEISRIREKLENGDTETSFAIGGTSFTMKEWDELFVKFDSIQEEMREQMREDAVANASKEAADSEKNQEGSSGEIS